MQQQQQQQQQQRNYQARRAPTGQAASTSAYPQNTQPAQPPQVSQAQQDLQRREELRRRDVAFRQARKPTDRNISDDIAQAVIGDGVDRYRKLRAVERKLDAAMMQKRLDIQENIHSHERREGVLRLWISNTAEGQPWQLIEDGNNAGDDVPFDFSDTNQASYRVKIQGRLLPDEDDFENSNDDPMDRDGQNEHSVAREKRLKMSHFFKSVTIEFDRAPSLQPDGFTSVEWKRTNNSDPEAEFDCLEFERKGDEEVQITINLARHEVPERYKLSRPMAKLLNADEADRATVVAGIWEYVRANGLQEDDENRKIACDEQLKAVFGMETLYFPYMPELIHHHFSPLDPIKLSYTIRVDRDYLGSGPGPSAPTIYDIKVPLPSRIKQTMADIISDPRHVSNLKSITNIDSDIALLVSKMNNIDSKRQFYESLARDPTAFIKRWMSSQQRDLEVVLAEGGRGIGDTRDDGLPLEVFRRGGADGVWGGDLARESVGLFLARNKGLTH